MMTIHLVTNVSKMEGTALSEKEINNVPIFILGMHLLFSSVCVVSGNPDEVVRLHFSFEYVFLLLLCLFLFCFAWNESSTFLLLCELNHWVTTFLCH